MAGPRLKSFLVWGLPALVVLALQLWPVASGGRTFVLRDVLEVHVMLVAPQVAALEDGFLPLVDLARSGGQPALGNLNGVPVYPTRALFLALPFFAAFGLHFVLHLLLAVPAVAWLGRAWGLSRPGAWAGGVVYGLSGFALSHANFFNLVASVALIPAFAAACLGLAGAPSPQRPLRMAGAAVLWALLLVSGDPTMAAVGLVFGLGTAVAVMVGRAPAADGAHPALGRFGLALSGALGLGTLLALPQLVELGRIVGSSFRALYRFDASLVAANGAWHPMALFEWLIPTFYGRIDRAGPGGFWAADWFGGDPPFYLSLAPGLLALAWVAVSGLDRNRRAVWAWVSIAVGTFFALGASNPVVGMLLEWELPGSGLLRYPSKAWPLVAIPLAVLAGLGFERTFGLGEDGRRRLRPFARALVGLGLAVVVFLAVTLAVPGAAEALVRSGTSDDAGVAEIAAVERGRWLALGVVQLATLVGGFALLVLARRRVRSASALLLAFHAASQLFLLKPLLITAETAQLQEPPALVQVLRQATPGRELSELRLVHGDYLDLFGTPPVSRADALEEVSEAAPHAYQELVPWAGVLHGLRYEGNRSSEGLDSYRFEMARVFLKQADDPQRLAVLESWGATHLILTRPLDGVPDGRARLVARLPPEEGVRARPIYLYELPRATPELFFAELAVPVPRVQNAWLWMVQPGFDPDRLAVVASDDGPVDDPGRVAGLVAESRLRGEGEARLLSLGDESLTVQVDSPQGGVLVTRRAHLPLWKASIDGEEVPTEAVNLSRLGVRVPAGEHRVRLWVDRRPLAVALAGSGAGLLILLVMVGWGALRKPPSRTARAS